MGQILQGGENAESDPYMYKFSLSFSWWGETILRAKTYCGGSEPSEIIEVQKMIIIKRLYSGVRGGNKQITRTGEAELQ